MTLQMRRRHLIASQKKKNWFDFSKVTCGATEANYDIQSYDYAYVEGDKYISGVGISKKRTVLKDSKTVLPKGKYVLSFTAYAPTVADGIVYSIHKYISPTNLPWIASSTLDTSLKAETYMDYRLSFSIAEETTIVIGGLQAIGWNPAEAPEKFNYEITNIRIEKVG